MLLSETESYIRVGENGKSISGPRAVGDPEHVEKSYVRNLRDLVVALMTRGRFMKEKSPR